MRRIVTKKQLDVLNRLQSDDSLTIQIGPEMNFIRAADGTSVGRVNMLSIRNLIKHGFLVAIQNVSGERTKCYRLSHEAHKTRFILSITERKGGAGGDVPTRAAIESFVADNGGKLVWYPCRRLFFLTVGDMTVPIATERDLTPIKGIRHFATMSEWKRFFKMEIADLRKRQKDKTRKA